MRPKVRVELSQRLRKTAEGPMEIQLATNPLVAVHVHFARTQDGRGLAYIINVSEQRELETRLARSEKMREIGELAAGVAHDCNNLLTVVMQTCSYLLRRHPGRRRRIIRCCAKSPTTPPPPKSSRRCCAPMRVSRPLRVKFSTSAISSARRQELIRRITGDSHQVRDQARPRSAVREGRQNPARTRRSSIWPPMRATR